MFGWLLIDYWVVATVITRSEREHPRLHSDQEAINLIAQRIALWVI
jgi:hypothetical protein